mmetsp:Transcript_49143/g.96893  ORF Transcript_49143/g.96893 Transcript_49143/m.96893 type:complete len:176 (-) Transcript_49143:366-893(-)
MDTADASKKFMHACMREIASFFSFLFFLSFFLSRFSFCRSKEGDHGKKGAIIFFSSSGLLSSARIILINGLNGEALLLQYTDAQTQEPLWPRKKPLQSLQVRASASEWGVGMRALPPSAVVQKRGLAKGGLRVLWSSRGALPLPFWLTAEATWDAAALLERRRTWGTTQMRARLC